MITRRHIRRCFIWVGVAIGVLGIAGYVLSFVGPVSHTWGGDRRISLGRGGLAVNWTVPDSALTGWTLMADAGVHWRWLPRWDEQTDPFTPQQKIGRLIIPYWIPILIGAAAAYVILPSGHPRGRCQKCGYDLKGVPGTDGPTDGAFVCPECGTSSTVA